MSKAESQSTTQPSPGTSEPGQPDRLSGRDWIIVARRSLVLAVLCGSAPAIGGYLGTLFRGDPDPWFYVPRGALLIGVFWLVGFVIYARRAKRGDWDRVRFFRSRDS